MSMPIPKCINLCCPSPRSITHVLLLPLIPLLLAGLLVAQTEQETKRTAAEKLVNEGEQLINEGTKDSLEAAMGKFMEALPLFRSLHDASWEAYSLNNIGSVYSRLGEKEKALGYYFRALQLTRTVRDRKGEAIALNNLGTAYGDLGEKRKALDYFAQALPVRRAARDQIGEATTLNNMAKICSDLGEKEKALEYAAQALTLARAIGERRPEAIVLIQMGGIYGRFGEFQKALDYFRQALPLVRDVGDRVGEAATLSNIGFIYSSLGETQKAIDYFTQALPIIRTVGDRGGEATILNNVGWLYYENGELRKALDYYTEFELITRAIGDRQREGVALNNMGLVYNSIGDKRKALDYYTRALLLKRAVEDRAGEAATLNNIGGVYNDLGETKKALDYVTQALSLSRAVADRQGEATCLSNFAYLERRSGNLLEALARIEAALDLIESSRKEIVNQELRASYFATRQAPYEFYIDLLMHMHKRERAAGYDGKALQASERARARSLVELLTESGADIRQGVDPQMVERENSLHQQLNAKAKELRSLSGPDAGRRASAIAKEIDGLTSELQHLAGQIRQRSPRYSALIQPRPLTLREIQTQALDTDTLLLEYSLGEERSYLWAVTPTSIQSYELPNRAKIEAAARRFSELLSTETPFYAAAAQTDDWQTASRLSQMLLGPIAAQLGQKRLLIVADGALQYLPFAALPDPVPIRQDAGGRRPLIVQHETVSLPSASVLVTLRKEMTSRNVAPHGVAVIADPVFYPDDERVKGNSSQNKSKQLQGPSIKSGILTARVERTAQEAGALRDGERLRRLSETRKEAEGILALAIGEKTKRALDFEANRELVVEGKLSQFRYLHFATHGLVDTAHPELTAIVLSLVDERGNTRDGYVRSHDIYNLNLSADVVVLSACETALGKEVRGEGLISLTRAFMYAGTPRVVVSLWAVRDDSTAELMVDFYRGMIKDRKRPADALRAAQLEMLKSMRWRAPHYWAPFVIQGEWR